jgi:DNA polymerase elongation subunit (family B)
MKTELIHGKEATTCVTHIDFTDGMATLFFNDGTRAARHAAHWALYEKSVDDTCLRLAGDQHYKYAKRYDSMKELKEDYGKQVYRNKTDGFVLWNTKEQYMVRHGVTYYKGLTPKDVSILSFDLETTSLIPSDNDKILLISNTFRDHLGNIERKLFSYEDFNSTKEMIYAWSLYVQDKNPAILCGHNILGFDIPYLSYFVPSLPIGHDGTSCEISTRTSEFRKEGSQTYSYNNATVKGREIIDTMFLSYKYDAASRKFESYGLKSIIRSLGLERSDREHYDGSQIRLRYQDDREWAKIKKYAEHDADDALALFDLMIPSYFYFTQSVPKTLQQVINGASGSQVNSWMLRAYLQDGHSIPKATEATDFEGAISFGNAGIYQNVSKVDVASLYPSIILEEQIYDKQKDPKRYFLEMVRYFTNERLRNKTLAAELGDKKYKDLEQSQKIFINSAYGFMGASGLHFNSPSSAALVTKIGRDILQKGMDWANKRGLTVINGDTDSFCYTGSKDFKEEIKSLNSEFPEKIIWTDDGQYKGMVIVKAKNYAMLTDTGIKIKGSGLKATMKEPALREFMNKVLTLLLEGKDITDIQCLYHYYADRIEFINKDTIKDWSSKKTVTKAILEPKRTNESRPAEAIKGKGLVEGDKFYVFFRTPEEVRCVEDFDGVYDINVIYKKLYATIKIFSPVLDITKFVNYSLKRNQRVIPPVKGELSKRGTQLNLDLQNKF